MARNSNCLSCWALSKFSGPGQLSRFPPISTALYSGLLVQLYSSTLDRGKALQSYHCIAPNTELNFIVMQKNETGFKMSFKKRNPDFKKPPKKMSATIPVWSLTIIHLIIFHSAFSRDIDIFRNVVKANPCSMFILNKACLISGNRWLEKAWPTDQSYEG